MEEKIKQLLRLYKEIGDNSDYEIIVGMSIPDEKGNRGMYLYMTGSEQFVEEIIIKLSERSESAKVIRLKDIPHKKESSQPKRTDVN